MWIYETPDFQKAVQEHSLRQLVDAKGHRIQHAATRAQASRLLKPYAGFLVTRYANFRLIGGVERVGSTEVFCWYEVLARGGAEYREFPHYARSIRARRFDRRLFTEWYEARVAAHIEASRPDQLPNDARGWLDPIVEVFESAAGDDDIIFETREWMQSVADLRDYHLPDLQKCVALLESQFPDVGPEVKVFATPSGGLRVAAQRTEARALFLLRLLRPEDVASDSSTFSVPLGDDALRTAGRAYPSWLLADPETWYEVERGEPLNLALSPEERNLLRSVGGYSVSNPELPMFVNGHAGSGKSTMLAYIFAGLCKRMVNQSEGRPLFVTYSDRLLNDALRTTKRILSAHPDTGKRYGALDLAPLFTSWTDHLLKMLPPEQKDRFDPTRRVDFHDVKLAWEGAGGKLSRNYNRDNRSAELVWYVIRTLIKGSDMAGDLDPDDYEFELTRLERTVTPEDYRSIFDNVYLKWYKPQLESRELWDDQDLIEAVLESIDAGAPGSRVAALVVDEAQDFTRRELRLITRTTMYSEYAVPNPGGGLRPPLIFAGDPLQTLSPTGFRWGAVKAGIFEELQGLFGDDARQPYFKELVNNYRSQGPIVRLANTIQLWRAVLFPGVEVKPQLSWQLESVGASPEKFVLDDVPVSDFTSFARDTIIIVPCEEGGEIAFINADPILSKMFPDASETNQPDTVFTAVGIKGLEFAKVVLYKFGEALPGIDWTPPSNASDTERDLAAEYFFNKLYVAATRATSSLYIADSAAGDENLWSRLGHGVRSQVLELAIKRRVPGFTIDDLGSVEDGHDLSGVQEHNPRENAIITRDYAKETRNPRQMRKAASFFRRADERQEADLCEAWALEFEGNLAEAGRKFADASSFTESWRCFWAAQDWDALDDIAPRVRDASAGQIAAVRLMSLNVPRVEDVEHFLTKLESGGDLPRATQIGWPAVIGRFSAAADSVIDTAPVDIVARVAEVLLQLAESGFSSVAESAAAAFVRVGNTATARRLLVSPAGPTSHRRGRLLFAIDGCPSGISHLIAAGLPAEAISAWEAEGHPLDGAWPETILPALSGVRRIETLISIGRAADAAAELVSGQYTRDEVNRLALQVCRSIAASEPLDEVVPVVTSLTSTFKMLKKADLYNEGLLAAAKRLEDQGWNDDVRREMQSIKQVVGEIYDDQAFRFDALKAATVPAYGAILEMADYTKRARTLYLRFADHSDPALKRYCRYRFLAVCTVELKSKVRGSERNEIQTLQHDNAHKWRIDLKNVDNTILATLPTNATETPTIRPTGEIGSLSWTYNRAAAKLTLVYDDGEVLANAAIERTKAPRCIGFDVVAEDDNGVTVAIPGAIDVQVEFGAMLQIHVTSGPDDLQTFVVAQLGGATPRRPTPSQSPGDDEKPDPRRRRRSPISEPRSARSPHRPITKNDLANELNISLQELGRRAKGAGVADRRGNEHFSHDEATKIRDFE